MSEITLWAIDPSYLDNFALKKCWNDANEVKNLIISKRHQNVCTMFSKGHELGQIKSYLFFIYLEGVKRGLSFESYVIDPKILRFAQKIGEIRPISIPESRLKKERQTFLSALKQRDSHKFSQLIQITKFDKHSSFKIEE